jgi:hypothetical protein
MTGGVVTADLGTTSLRPKGCGGSDGDDPTQTHTPSP